MNQELENKLAKDFPFMVAKNVWTGEICLDGGNTYGELVHRLVQGSYTPPRMVQFHYPVPKCLM